MRTMIFLLAALTASLAHADVSDSGNLNIGGYGVIAGTMTVQGSAFSVGGTTFSVAGGSVTFGGIINAAASGIKWADGSTSTSASGGGSGDVSAAGNNAFTGANTFSSTVTFTGSVPGVCVEVDSKTLQNVSSVTFRNVASSTPYVMDWNFLKNTAGHLRLQIDGGTSSYRWVERNRNDTNSGNQWSGATAGSYCPLQDVIDNISNTDSHKGILWIESHPGTPTAMTLHGVGYGYESVVTMTQFACKHWGGIASHELSFFTDAGTMTGYVRLMRCAVRP